jgi:TDG/mug DNA glycosylase family protein
LSGFLKDKALPDIISGGLKILFVGFNPGMHSAREGHHYAGASNRFWRLLYESGLTPYRLSPDEDRKLLDFGYGSTNIADRPTRQAGELTAEELAEGCGSLARLVSDVRPEIVCYVGIGVYRIFRSYMTGIPKSRLKIAAGLQSDGLIDGVRDFVCSNPSGLNTIPYSLQLDCFKALKELAEAIRR